MSETLCLSTFLALQDHLSFIFALMQSVTADFYEEEHRGRAFGTLHLTSAAGAAFGGLYATNMGECANNLESQVSSVLFDSTQFSRFLVHLVEHVA